MNIKERGYELGKVYKVNKVKAESLVTQREYERYQDEYPEPPEVHITEERLQWILARDPGRVPCTKDKPADLTQVGVPWLHMDAKEIYDDGEHYLQYECLNCGSLYDVWIPDCQLWNK